MTARQNSDAPSALVLAATPELRTDRLLLRSWCTADLEPFAAVNADPVVAQFLGPPLDRASSDAMVARIQDGWRRSGHGLWAVEVLDGPKFAGFVGLVEVPFQAPFTPAVEIGWRLDRAAWGHGYATEAARAALAWAFSELRLPGVVSFTAVGNTRSRAVMRRLGMTHDPADDFDHPQLAPTDPLRRHVLHRIRPSAATHH